jgi:hypothetical protein
MKIEYIVIAKTIPEISKKDGREYSCTVGYSPELGFIRVYPVPLIGFKRWYKYIIDVERNNRDTRKESWKLSSMTRTDNFIGLEKEIICIGKVNKDFIISMFQEIVSPSISKLNEERKSIGVIKTNQLKPYWDVNKNFVNTSQFNMFEDVQCIETSLYTKDQYLKESRISFNDLDGIHNLQLNDWQYYEFQRKFGAKKEAFRYISKDKDNYILIGNMYQHRNIWIGLGVHECKNILSKTLQLF